MVLGPVPQDERERDNALGYAVSRLTEYLISELRSNGSVNYTYDEFQKKLDAVKKAALPATLPEKSTTPLEAVSKAALLGLMDEWCPFCWYSFSTTANGATVSRTKPCPRHATLPEPKLATLGEMAEILSLLAKSEAKRVEGSDVPKILRAVAVILLACDEWKKDADASSGYRSSAMEKLYGALP